MSKSGKVMSWNLRRTDTGKKYGYGFAVTTDGVTAYIPGKELGKGMRLKVGGQINFDTTVVEGHDGRVMATNVSGPGVIEWEEWKASLSSESKELAEKTKAEWAAHKESQQGWTPREPTPRGVSTPTNKAGGQLEKRKDIDGKYYTKQEFFLQYSGYKEWNAKAPKPPVGRPAGGRGAGGLEKRKDVDGRFYSKQEFMKEYGGYSEWNAAAPAAGRGGGRGRGRR
eukprot:Hpha_TRINITY_DN36660_c0_g1::TRINITY_DN36660_c0_g1_i1::g.18742::m.18742